jgi:hypothetical protein
VDTMGQAHRFLVVEAVPDAITCNEEEFVIWKDLSHGDVRISTDNLIGGGGGRVGGGRDK